MVNAPTVPVFPTINRVTRTTSVLLFIHNEIRSHNIKVESNISCASVAVVLRFVEKNLSLLELFVWKIESSIEIFSCSGVTYIL